MLIKLKESDRLEIELSKKYKMYFIILKVKSRYLKYDVVSKICYESLMEIIENIENMLFAKYRYSNNIQANKIRFEFNQDKTEIKIAIKLSDNQEYCITLNRINVINFYNYLTKYLKTFNKRQMIDFNKKFTYVKVRYIDIYTSTRYSYISENPTIEVGDIVYVDRAGTKCLAVVESKDEYYYEQVPYPVLETKRILKIVTKVRKYKFLKE